MTKQVLQETMEQKKVFLLTMVRTILWANYQLVTKVPYQPAVASGELTYYENKFMGIQFDVNDALSVSYNVDESDKNVRAAVAVGA